MAAVDRRDAAIRARDMALAMHETFMTSGSEDSLSPKPQNAELGVSPRGLEFCERSLGQGVLNEALLKNMRMTEFAHHDRGAARLNHGSFGSSPKSVLAVQAEWQSKWLKQPDAFYYRGLENGLLVARRAVAEHVGCPVRELVLVDNATVSASIVAQDVMWGFVNGRYQNGDSILMLNFAYKAVVNAFKAYGVRAGAQLLVVEIPFPVKSSSDIITSFEESLRRAQTERRRILLAVLDHIVSMPSIILPVKEMVAMCRAYGVEQVFVDGAQAIGQVDINVGQIDADYYTSNLNKWMFAPATASLFHCKPQHLARLHHPIVSDNYGKGLVEECNWVGTRDYSALLAVPACFQFVGGIPGGLEAIKAHNHERIVAVGKMLAESWGTHCGVPPDLVGCMVTVGLPPALGISTAQEVHALRTHLRLEYSVEVHAFVPNKLQSADGLLDSTKSITAYVRVSHQLYNTWDEYLRLRDVVTLLVSNRSESS